MEHVATCSYMQLYVATCSCICRCITAVANSLMLQLYLKHDFYNIMFKIKFYIASVPAPSLHWTSLRAHLSIPCRYQFGNVASSFRIIRYVILIMFMLKNRGCCVQKANKHGIVIVRRTFSLLTQRHHRTVCLNCGCRLLHADRYRPCLWSGYTTLSD
jgi:hypothetical protein